MRLDRRMVGNSTSQRKQGDVFWKSEEMKLKKTSDDMLFGPYGAASLSHAAILQDYGANAVWFHGFDPQAFANCEEHGLAACVEFQTFRADFGKHPGLIPIGIDGKPIRYGSLVQGVCLSNKEFLAETEACLAEGISQFKPRGIWLDYLTYAGWFETPNPDLQESCFCKSCIDDFCEKTGIDADSPALILNLFAKEWMAHKCARISGHALHYAELIRFRHPDCIIGAYMCPWKPEEFNGALSRIFAQDYQMLADAIDVFTPLIYAAKSGRAGSWGKEYLEDSGRFIPPGKKIQLILDYQDFPQSLDSAAEAHLPSWGIQVFSGGDIFDHPDQAAAFRRAVLAIRQAAG